MPIAHIGKRVNGQRSVIVDPSIHSTDDQKRLMKIIERKKCVTDDEIWEIMRHFTNRGLSADYSMPDDRINDISSHLIDNKCESCAETIRRNLPGLMQLRESFEIH